MDNSDPVQLARTVRFSLPLGVSGAAVGSELVNFEPVDFGEDQRSVIGAFQELDVAVRGQPHPATGYLINISEIDHAVRRNALPILWKLIESTPEVQPSAILPAVLSSLELALGSIVAKVTWRISPYHSQSMSADARHLVLIRQQLEFSASHRLNVDTLSPAQNREIFGKCNNPNGHGHNYRIETAVAVPVDPSPNDKTFSLHDLERIVREKIIQRFDHKHLNLDTTEFANLNPSVENIARVCYDLLRKPLAEAGGSLRSTTIWETEKTRCTYPASLADLSQTDRR